MTKRWILVSAMIAALALGPVIACSEGERWAGWFYPKGPTDLTVSTNLGEFTSLDDCRASARRAIERNGGLGDYECGLNCRMDDTGFSICKETLH